MKKIVLILMFITTTSAMAQGGFGIKGGVNYSDNGRVEYSDLTGAGENVLQESADRRTGYHVGIFYGLDLGPFYIRPELLYTQTRSSYTYKSRNEDLDITKLDLPVLAGIKVFGPVHVFAGPSLQYVMNTDFSGAELSELEKDFTVGAQFGLGLQLGRLGIDARYEQALSNRQADLMADIMGGGYERIDSRPNQFILSLSLNL